MDLRNSLAEHPNAGLMIYSTFATAAVAALLLTNWPTYHHVIRGGPAVLWYYIAVGSIIVPIVFAEPGLAARLVRNPVFWWLVAFVISGTLWLLLAQDYLEWAMTIWNTRLVALGLFASVCIAATESHKRVIAFVIMACVAFACACVWFDALRPHRFIPFGAELSHTGRGAGFFINPNVAASFVAAAVLVALPLLPMRFRSWAIILGAVAIVPTFSRAGFLYIALMLIGPAFLKLLNRSQVATLAIVSAVLIAGTAVSYDFLVGQSDDRNVDKVVQRLEWFQQEAEDDVAAEGRRYGAQLAWQMFLTDPILGRGIAATRVEPIVAEGPHNMYLMLMAEQGFLGLFLYPALIAVIALRGRAIAKNAEDTDRRDLGKAMMLYAVFLALYGLFSHNVLEEPHGMFLLAVLIAAGFAGPREPQYAAWEAPSDMRRRSNIPAMTARLRQS